MKLAYFWGQIWACSLKPLVRSMTVAAEKRNMTSI